MLEARCSFLIRLGIGFVWLFTGLAVLHPFYREEGMRYLSPLGLPEWVMFATCAFEVALGLWVLLRPASKWITLLQIAMIVTFTLILSIQQPRLLAHPFGVLSKNFCLLAMIVSVFYLDREGWSWRAEWSLRLGMAFIWVWDGIVPCILMPALELEEVLDFLGLGSQFLIWIGISQAISGVLVLVLRGWIRQMILISHLFGICAITGIVTFVFPELWFHPFGPLTKNVPLILGTYILTDPWDFWREKP